ncbi:hypothetical protein OF83DRAFT_1112956 [Amylostereum chailletii]|nr:hypothetical protein OF83DRAFT_1112956 [Amylostereum chailletii]
MLFQILLAIGLLGPSLVAGQSASAYCDGTTGICFQGYTDPAAPLTIGLVFPPLSTGTTPNATEFIAQIVAPITNGWSGLSVGGTMENSLLFTLWPNGDDVILGTRWTDAYVLPEMYPGPILTVLPGSGVNSTHINASFRCQNCTAWQGGSIGGGDLNSFQLIAYVTSTTPVDDPSDVNSTFTEHDYFNFCGLQLNTAHSDAYNSYISGSSATSSSPAPTSTSSPPTSTSSSSGATQTQYGQCGGTGWTGPTACAEGFQCVPVSAPYYSQCQ